MAELQRKFYQTLLKWKNTKNQECLLVKGARQVGKTFIIDKFGREQYRSYIYLNFLTHPELKQIFADSLEAAEIYKKISIQVNDVSFIEHNTLIFLDEIQVCPNARTALKFLALDNRYDVIASGSLLGLHYRQIASIPVGYERIVEMFSLDFEEFLWAIGKTPATLRALRDYFTHHAKIEDIIHQELLNIMHEYLVVGGMPEAVLAFIRTNNFQEVYATQQKILASYQDDIANYATLPERQKITACYQSIPQQLAREYTKFQYALVSPHGSAKRYHHSLDWLIDAGMAQKCFNVAPPILPLAAYEKRTQFKFYLSDIGLLTSMYGFAVQQALLNKTLVGPAKGGIYENLVFDLLHKRDISLHYYKDEHSTQEIEFLIETAQGVIPIEVKSKNGATPSLNSFIKKYHPPKAYKIITGNQGVQDEKISIPFYLAIFI